MAVVSRIRAIDSHTEGMPTRVVVSGVDVPPGATMLERKLAFEASMDDVRLLLMREPRGHAAMSGAVLTSPCREDADWGVLFIEVSGCLPMCGHGTIGVATVLVESGLVEVSAPVTVIRLDTPAGLVEASVAVSDDGRATSVTLRNVPAFVHALDQTVDVPELGGPVSYDMAFGGNFYALVDASRVGLAVSPSHASTLIAAGAHVLDRLPQPVHPLDGDIRGCKHVVFYEPSEDPHFARAATSIHPGWLDRSPCGTGTSARLAALWARGLVRVGEDFVNESVIGTRFVARAVQEVDVAPGVRGIVPTITGRAWLTGSGDYVLHDDDPFPAGFDL